jgi:hypothetical protein
MLGETLDKLAKAQAAAGEAKRAAEENGEDEQQEIEEESKDEEMVSMRPCRSRVFNAPACLQFRGVSSQVAAMIDTRFHSFSNHASAKEPLKACLAKVIDAGGATLIMNNCVTNMTSASDAEEIVEPLFADGVMDDNCVALFITHNFVSWNHLGVALKKALPSSTDDLPYSLHEFFISCPPFNAR